MGSNTRRKSHLATVRLYDDQDAFIEHLKAQAPEGVTRADVIRHLAFGDPLLPRPACTPKHRGRCCAQHIEMVREYQTERDRQMRTFEELTGAYDGDAMLARENGVLGPVQFKQWLVEHNQQPRED